MNLALEKYQYIEGYERATLPERYKTAKKAIASCVNMDVLKEIRDKTAALKTYARMSMDDELYLMAMKVQNQAKVRMGELIREVGKALGAGEPKTISGTSRNGGRGQAAKKGGVGPSQADEAIAMSRVPEKKREKLIESGATSAAETRAKYPKRIFRATGAELQLMWWKPKQKGRCGTFWST